jgi:peptidyl-prolyl cis-trans isomerase C
MRELITGRCRYIVTKAMTPEASVRARHVLVSTEEECEKLKAKIEAGELTFAEAAEGYSSCPSGKGGGKLGTFGPGRMVPAFDKVCFSAASPLNQPIGPVQTHFGFHLILIEWRHMPGADDKKAA